MKWMRETIPMDKGLNRSSSMDSCCWDMGLAGLGE